MLKQVIMCTLKPRPLVDLMTQRAFYPHAIQTGQTCACSFTIICWAVVLEPLMSMPRYIKVKKGFEIFF